MYIEGGYRGARDFIRGTLLCLGNAHKYEIDRGVPVLIPPGTFEDQIQVANTFAQKWDMVPDYGHDTATRDFQREWYLRRFGWETVGNLRQFLEGKERILDAGCGLGRDVKFYAENAKGTVFGVDISGGIILAQEKLDHLPNVYIIKADMTRLPFPDDYFDFVACDQALHHTPNTRISFMELVRHVKLGATSPCMCTNRKVKRER